MPDNNNYDSEKEMMKINNVNIPLNKWINTNAILSKTASNIIHENKKNKNEYRDYKQLNLDTASDSLLSKIDNNEECSILDNMSDEFIDRKENRELLEKIFILVEPVIEKSMEKNLIDLRREDLNDFHRKIHALFSKSEIYLNKSYIDRIMILDDNLKMREDPTISEFLDIKKHIKPLLKQLINNVRKNEIEIFNGFLEENNSTSLKNTINSFRVIEENEKMRIMFGVEPNELSLTEKQINSLDDKLTAIQRMKNKFNEELSSMTSEMINANRTKLATLQTEILALEDMTIFSAGFDKLGLFTSDITNAVSNHEMRLSGMSFNTRDILDIPRANVINHYKGDERVREYKYLMFKGETFDMQIPELTPKWYRQLHKGTGITEETIMSMVNDVNSIMKEIKAQPVVKNDSPTPKTENQEPKDDKNKAPENTTNSPFDNGPT